MSLLLEQIGEKEDILEKELPEKEGYKSVTAGDLSIKREKLN